MSNRVSDFTAQLEARLFNNSEDDVRAIEALERENFELRNEVTRLSLHNATLRRMLTKLHLKSE